MSNNNSKKTSQKVSSGTKTKVVKKPVLNTKKEELLNEATIRRFMKLANIQPIGGLMNETFGGGKEVKMEEETAVEEQEELTEMDMGSDDEMPPMGDEMPEEMPEPDPEKEAMVADLVSAIADAIQNVSGVSVNVSGAGVEGGAEGDMDMGAEMAPHGEPDGDEMPPLPPVEGGEEGMEGGEGEEEEDEPEYVEEVVELGEGDEIDESAKNPYKGTASQKWKKSSKVNEAINMIAKRVAERLLSESKKKQAPKAKAKK